MGDYLWTSASCSTFLKHFLMFESLGWCRIWEMGQGWIFATRSRSKVWFHLLLTILSIVTHFRYRAARRGMWKDGVNAETPAEYKRRYANASPLEAAAEKSKTKPRRSVRGWLRRLFSLWVSHSLVEKWFWQFRVYKHNNHYLNNDNLRYNMCLTPACAIILSYKTLWSFGKKYGGMQLSRSAVGLGSEFMNWHVAWIALPSGAGKL